MGGSRRVLHWTLVTATTVVVADAQPVDQNVSANFTASVPANGIVCIYPLIGQYYLNRILLYSLLAFAAASQRWTWLSIGALEYIMNYSATAAVHAILLAATGGSRILDLDALGAWCILSSVTVALIPAIWLSERIENSKYRPLFAFWGTFVSIGSMAAVKAMFTVAEHETPCSVNLSSGRQIMLSTPAQLDLLNPLNCTYSCFDTGQAMRSRDDIVAISFLAVYNQRYYLVWSIVITMLTGWILGPWSCCLAGARRRTRAESKEIMSIPITWDYWPSRRRLAALSRARARKEYETGKYQRTSCWAVYINFPAFLVVIVMNEVYANSKSLPKDESAFAVGQWAPWVTVSLAMIASSINGR